MQSRTRRETKSFNIPDVRRDFRRSQEKTEHDGCADISSVTQKAAVENIPRRLLGELEDFRYAILNDCSVG